MLVVPKLMLGIEKRRVFDPIGDFQDVFLASLAVREPEVLIPFAGQRF